MKYTPDKMNIDVSALDHDNIVDSSHYLQAELANATFGSYDIDDCNPYSYDYDQD